jgi:uncharacterized protein
MSHVPHDLAEEFPDATDILHRLKTSDTHFAGLAERYHRHDTGVEPASDEHVEGLKRQRLTLLDEISGAISKAKVA